MKRLLIPALILTLAVAGCGASAESLKSVTGEACTKAARSLNASERAAIVDQLNICESAILAYTPAPVVP